MATICQALGMTPAVQAMRTEKQNFVYNQDKGFMDRTTRLKNDYSKSVKAGEGVSEVRDAWAKLQEKRVESGLTRQPMSTLLRAPQEQNKREKQTVGGLQYNKNNKREVESMQ